MSESTPRIVALIPAYKPQPNLLAIAQGLSACGMQVVVVDDGSGREYDQIFQKLGASADLHVVRHAVNLGKGAALKTGMNYALTSFPELLGVVTADADGQHDVDDIQHVADHLARQPQGLILGVRRFTQDVPTRNRLGNILTKYMVRLLMGKRISDTQTGLRGIPQALMKDLLRIPSTGYEFELDMLITATHRGIQIIEEPIRTIYDHPGSVSHFNPLVDSMKIYFVLLRFGLVSLFTAILDNLVFFLVFHATSSIIAAQVFARTIAVLFNYTAARSAVFLSRERHTVIFPKYVVLVIVNLVVSYGLITFIVSQFHIRVMWAKLAAEAALFLANFAIQRDFVFTRQQRDHDLATNWTEYYERIPATAKLTRKYTTHVLIQTLRTFAGETHPTVVEIGGANSCFLDELLRNIHPARVDIIDLNEFGLELLRKRLRPEQPVVLHREDCRTVSLPHSADAVFSVGLIEHFDPKSTREATLAHFRLLRPGGLLIVTFPTPTWLYRVSRAICEALGLWKFPDERPLKPGEVLATIREQGTVLHQKTLWPLFLTQHMIVARKHV